MKYERFEGILITSGFVILLWAIVSVAVSITRFPGAIEPRLQLGVGERAKLTEEIASLKEELKTTEEQLESKIECFANVVAGHRHIGIGGRMKILQKK